jgi:transposase
MKMGKQGLMSTQEVDRYTVIGEVIDKKLRQSEAANRLGIGVRQVKRLCREVRAHGAIGLISKRRGKPSNRRIADAQRAHFLALVSQHYSDFGPELAREYLQSKHAFPHSTETLRGWMIQAGLWQAKARKTTRIHPPRQRRGGRGELVQIDGSHHDWFEGRAAKCCLIAFIDDATGHVLGARFSPTETTQAYFDVLQHCVQTHGRPVALYSDRHSIFTKHDSEDPVPTQFERALLQLGIEPIQAHSPQAKGRVERLFQTLQDRMTRAMRVDGISSMEHANAWLGSYMAEHNQRYGVTARETQDAHRAFGGAPQELARICAMHHQRQLSTQLSCQFEGSVVQLHPRQIGSPQGRCKVDIVQYANGRIEVLYRHQLFTHSHYVLHPHLARARAADDKNVNDTVDKARAAQQLQLAKLKAQMAHQDAQRANGIYSHDTHPSPPTARTGTARYGLRPAQAVPVHPRP